MTVHTEAGSKRLTSAHSEAGGTRQTFRAAMGLPRDLRQTAITAGGETLQIAVMDFGNPQAVLLGPLPDRERFARLGSSLEHHQMFPAGTNIEFAQVESPESVRILIWERGVGPTFSSGTGSCAALVAAAAFGGASRQADVIAPGGPQRVEWLDDSVYLTGWAEILFDGEWLRETAECAVTSRFLMPAGRQPVRFSLRPRRPFTRDAIAARSTLRPLFCTAACA